MRPLPRKFYSDDTVDVAKNLLGKILVRQIGEKTFSGIITETEAYRFNDDPARLELVMPLDHNYHFLQLH